MYFRLVLIMSFSFSTCILISCVTVFGSGDYKKCDRIEHESERIIICLIKDNFLPKTLYTIKVEAKNRIGNTSIQTLVDPWYLGENLVF